MKKKSSDDNYHKGHRETVRRRFMVGGLDVFAPHEILEFLLYYAIPQRDTNPLAHRLINAYGSLYNVMSSPVQELKAADGVGDRTAVFLSLIFQLYRRMRLQQIRRESTDFRSTPVAVRYFQELFSGQREEAVYQLCLNAQGHIVVCHSLAQGNIVSVTMNMKTLIANAILHHCVSVVIAHNHPGGDAHPLKEDYAATNRMKDAFDAVNIELQDHIIIGENDYASMKEIGYLDEEPYRLPDY